jgi:hypothetical protein
LGGLAAILDMEPLANCIVSQGSHITISLTDLFNRAWFPVPDKRFPNLQNNGFAEQEYSPGNLNNYFFKSRIILREKLEIKYPDQSEYNIEYYGIVSSIPGEITLYFVPGRLGFDKDDDRSWENQIKDKMWMLTRQLMDEIYYNLEGSEE